MGFFIIIVLIIIAVIAIVCIKTYKKNKYENVDYIISILHSKSTEELDEIIKTSATALVLYDMMVKNKNPNASSATRYEKYYCYNVSDVKKLNNAARKEGKQRTAN